jgi:hypothetical protein
MDRLSSSTTTEEDPRAVEKSQQNSSSRTSQSAYSLSSSSIPPPAYSDPIKELTILRATTLGQGYHILTSDQALAYQVVNSSFTIRTPDVALYGPAGPKAGPMLATSRFSLLTSPIDICLRALEAQDCQWETLEKERRLSHACFGFSVTMAFGSEGVSRRSFTWKRSHGQEVVGGAKFSMRNFKLVDNRTEEVVAVFLAVGPFSWMNRGKFQLRRDWGPQWEIAVLITKLALMEKARRRERVRRGSGGGTCGIS